MNIILMYDYTIFNLRVAVTLPFFLSKPGPKLRPPWPAFSANEGRWKMQWKRLEMVEIGVGTQRNDPTSHMKWRWS